jgi:hypothetical protein
MKYQFRDIHLSKKNLEKLDLINSIIEEYQDEGYVLTLRQLYYQLVSRDIIPNQQKEYSKLSILLKEGRMGGIVDWEAIEDRMRVPKIPYYVKGIENAIEDTIDQYRLDRQIGQDTYLEVWVEKDALSGVLSRITNKYHIRIMVNRGYSSVSAMYDAFMRFRRYGFERNRKVKILYLGDFDPSGLDMIRDINERIREFSIGYYSPLKEYNFRVEHIALTKEQIDQYNPPPNPTKVTDPRAKEFIRKHGNTSWEVDALKPETLNYLLEATIRKNIDVSAFDAMVEKEQIDKDILRNITTEL